jgi:RimJ/RimL family protein N-acetyltransferase
VFSQTEIITERLRLVPVTTEVVRAYFQDRAKLSVLLGAEVPIDWPVDPVILEVLKGQMDKKGAFTWADFVYIHKADRKVMGDGGFKGPPGTDGRVEIGYAVLPEYRRKGLATEAARALLEMAFSHEEVQVVCAETVVNGLASAAVLQKIGMRRSGERRDDEDGDLFCWRVTREKYEEDKQFRESR